MKELARRINYFTSSFVAILGFSLISEIVQEDDMPDKLDDLGMLILAIGSIWWYKKNGYKTISAMPSVLILGIGLIIKLGGIMIEHADKDALGDDIGIFVALLLAFVFVVWQVFRSRSAK